MSGSISIACDPQNVLGVRWHPILVDLVWWVVDFAGEVVATSGRRYRSLYAGDSGIHMTDPLRALDIRYYIYNNPDKLRDIINRAWQYDRTRPGLKCALLHDVGKGKHFHLQVHDRTIRIR